MAEMISPFVYRGLPHRVVFGRGRIAEAPQALAALSCSRALVLSTREQQESAERVRALLADKAVGVFAGAVMHTPVAVTETALAAFAQADADSVVAIGGGSTIGLGKAIALRTDAPQLVIPTTYAGSEVTSILGETRDGLKTTQRSPKVLPEVVIYDVDLTLSLPTRLSATSGMNAMAHAVEALYARDRNPIVSLMAEEGLRALAVALPNVVRDGADIEARSAAQYGAWLCGMCLDATAMALHHKLCHVLGGTFDLPHAETHAIVLPHAIAYNREAAPEAMRSIGRALGAADPAAAMDALLRSLGAPTALKDLGMPAAGIDRATELALADPYWNPRALEESAIRELIARAHAGAPPQ
jgi:alcohol dehydrogenase class IV